MSDKPDSEGKQDSGTACTDDTIPLIDEADCTNENLREPTVELDKHNVVNFDRSNAFWKSEEDHQGPSNSRKKSSVIKKSVLKCSKNRVHDQVESNPCCGVKHDEEDILGDYSNTQHVDGAECVIPDNEDAPTLCLEEFFSVMSTSSQNPRASSLPPQLLKASQLGNRALSSQSNGPQHKISHQSSVQRNNISQQSCFQSFSSNQQCQPAPQLAQQQHLSPQRNKDLSFYNWQSTKMTVKERLTFLFNNSILSDVTFVVGRDNYEQRIPAHRFVLSVGSAVFDAMFNSTWPTSNEEIPLPDVEPASFLALLKFLYSDEVQICPETVMTTLYTAKKYAVPALEKNCVDYLKRHLCADNAFLLLTQARLFDEPQLAALCLETIDKSTPDALSAEGFTDIDIDTLSVVLDRDSLRIKEAKLFSHVIRWSEAECMRQGIHTSPENKRTVLGPILSKIRFPLMTVEEFAQGPAQSGILDDRECVSLFLYFTVNPKPPVAFLEVPRCSMNGKEQTVCRFLQIESRWGYSGTADKIRFVTDRKIFVVGFGLYGSIHGPSEYNVAIQIFQSAGSRLVASNENTFLSDGTNSTFRVMFKEPVEIQADVNYTACATLKGLDSHYGTKGLRQVKVDCPTGEKVTFQFSYAAGNNNGTSVEDGQIPEIIFYL